MLTTIFMKEEGASSYKQIYAGRYSYGRISVTVFKSIDRLFIGDFVLITRGTHFLTERGEGHNITNFTTFPVDVLIIKDFRHKDTITKGGITIGSDVWIGTNTLILVGGKVR